MDIVGVLEPFISQLARHAAVTAAAVVGSRASGVAGLQSDVDIFVYTDDTERDRVLAVRRSLAGELADPASVCVIEQTGHPYADVWALRHTNTYLLDVMWWTQQWAETELDWRLLRHSPQPGGPSTAFWRSIRDGISVFDRSGWLDRIQQRAQSPYPEQLRRNILDDDLDLLGSENPFSFRNQVVKAVSEGDRVSVQHRTAKWLEVYFDALFAANRVLHPGEKRLVHFVESECPHRPADLRGPIDHVVALAASLDPAIALHLDAMKDELDRVVDTTEPTT